MRFNVFTISAVAGSALLLGLAFSQVDMSAVDHSAMPGMNMNATTSPGTSSAMNHDATTSASSTNLERLSGTAFDRAFLSMMAEHHRMAVDMSEAVLPVANDDTVRRWARRIVSDQKREIAQMTAWLEALGGPDAAGQTVMRGEMSGMAERVERAADPQRAFVRDMIPHHASAINMASMALRKSANPRVLALARDVARAQAEEIYDFRQWLAQN